MIKEFFKIKYLLLSAYKGLYFFECRIVWSLDKILVSNEEEATCKISEILGQTLDHVIGYDKKQIEAIVYSRTWSLSIYCLSSRTVEKSKVFPFGTKTTYNLPRLYVESYN